MTAQSNIEDVLDFWFGELDDAGMAAPEKSKGWWKKDDAFDTGIRERFGALRSTIMRGEHEDWRETPRGLLAYVIVLDQFSRNLGRGTPAMFEADARSLEAACAGIDAGLDEQLPGDMRAFLYMPLMHCEGLEEQDRCIALFEAARDGSDGKLRERLASNVGFAKSHRDIVARFGRFPHRNAILGRESTDEEAAFLKEPGSSF